MLFPAGKGFVVFTPMQTIEELKKQIEILTAKNEDLQDEIDSLQDDIDCFSEQEECDLNHAPDFETMENEEKYNLFIEHIECFTLKQFEGFLKMFKNI